MWIPPFLSSSCENSDLICPKHVLYWTEQEKSEKEDQRTSGVTENHPSGGDKEQKYSILPFVVIERPRASGSRPKPVN